MARRRLSPNGDLFRLDGLSEAQHQQILFRWAALNERKWPELKWLHASAQGATYGENADARAIRGAQMKRQGVKKGVADLCLPVRSGGFSGLYIELKRHGGKLSPEQAEFGDFVTGQGHFFCVCVGWEAAARTIEGYLNDKK